MPGQAERSSRERQKAWRKGGVYTSGVTKKGKADQDFLLQSVVVFGMHSTVYFDVCGRTGIPGKIIRYHYDFLCAVCRSVTVSDIRVADSTLPSSGAEMRSRSHNFDQYGSKYYLEC